MFNKATLVAAVLSMSNRTMLPELDLNPPKSPEEPMDISKDLPFFPASTVQIDGTERKFDLSKKASERRGRAKIAQARCVDQRKAWKRAGRMSTKEVQ